MLCLHLGSMKRLTLTGVLLFSITSLFSQENILLIRKNGKTIRSYWTGSVIAFQLHDGVWVKGDITRIQKDSFYVRPTMVNYQWFGTDTVRYNPIGFSLSDINVLPKKGVLVDYKNGEARISRSGGHVHWYWIKSGWIFRTAALGYTGLHVANGVIKNDFSVSQSRQQLAVAAGVFVFGLFLKWSYKPIIRVGKKYRVETLLH
jgi:hypothetical protein